MNYENLVFQGGGIKGFIYSGVIKALNDMDKSIKFKRTIGTSVGSMCAFIFALRPTNEELNKYMNLVINKILKLNDSFISEAYNFLHYYGIHDNECICDLIEEIELDKFGKNGLTFLDLFNLTNMELTIVGTCLSERKIYYFNYLNSPNMLVSTAIKISSALPGFYKSVTFDNKIWCDGGVCNNFPINYYDDKTTLGLMLMCDDDLPVMHTIDSEKQFFQDVVATSMSYQINFAIGKTPKNIITLNTGNISTTDFKISKKEIDLLINQGYDDTVEYFNINTSWFKFW